MTEATKFPSNEQVQQAVAEYISANGIPAVKAKTGNTYFTIKQGDGVKLEIGDYEMQLEVFVGRAVPLANRAAYAEKRFATTEKQALAATPEQRRKLAEALLAGLE